MTAPTLKSLALSTFRGSSMPFTLEFEKGKKLTLIYGENGTGKTTICDAFEFLAAEKIGSLEERGIGRGLEKYWPTAGKASKDLAVTLQTGSGQCVGRVLNKKASITPATAKPRIELLRRQQVLHLIDAQPAGRYNSIKHFIDIAAFEASEEALRQLGKSLTQDREQAAQSEAESLTTLQGFFDAEKPSAADPVTWAKAVLAAPIVSFDEHLAALGKLRNRFAGVAAFPGRFKTSTDAVVAATKALDIADTQLAAAVGVAGADASELLSLLESGQSYLHSHPTAGECPLCGSAEKAAGLSEAIRARLARLAALKGANAERQKRHSELTRAEGASQQAEKDCANAIKAFTDIVAGHTWPTDVTLPTGTPPPGDAAALEAWLLASAPAEASWAGLEASWHGNTKFVAALKSAVQQYDTNLARRVELDNLVPRIEQALKLCVAQRQAFTDGIIKEIAEEVGKLYEAVHPGEGLDAIALPLDPAKRASLELTAKFSGQDVPPQAYFSQSHLDTLGLCVFLALALRDRPEDKILILDDVLGSVDEPHVERVIQMIYGISGKFCHTIVTTHYRPWREKYRWGWLKAGQACQFVELSDWALADGIRVVNSLPEIDRLKLLISAMPPDPQAICSKAGVILEAALDYLTQKYECSVPRRYGAAYTLGDLLPSINTKLRAALKAEILDAVDASGKPAPYSVELKPILDELERIAQARNAFGAHFKAISFELLDTDAIAFASNVVRLMDALTHPADGWPNNDKSGSYWRNSGDSRRLHPLKKPG